MIELIKDVSGLVPQELERASRNWPLFASDHEGMSILLEEIEETEDELKQVKKLYSKLWGFVKEDGQLLTLPDEIKAAALQLAAEAIQVAAMAEKLKKSRAEREGGEVL